MRFLVFWLLLAAVHGGAVAQTASDQLQRDLQRLQQRELERNREREEEFRRSQESEPNGAVIANPDDPVLDGKTCVRVEASEIVGVTRLDPARFAGALAGLKSDCTPAADIDALLRDITNAYVADGFITTRALIAADALQDGTLRILVVEGQLDSIIALKAEGARPYRKGEIATAFPNLRGRALNLRDLEQGVDQLARLRSAEASIDIVPSETPGASDIGVKRVALRRWIRPFVSLDNDGSLSTGRLQGTAGVEVDSPLGIGDYWSFYRSGDLEGSALRGNAAFGGFVSVPYGYTTLSLNAAKSSYRGILTSNAVDFATEGDTINGSLAVDQLIYRDGKTKLSVAGRLALLDTENRIQQIRLGTNSYRLVTANVDLRLQRRLGNWFLFATATYTRGLDMLGADFIDLGPDGPRVEFDKLSAYVSAEAPLKLFGVPVYYSIAVSGAAAFDPVLPAERFNLGGLYTVRGFRDDGISGRAGALARQQLTVGLFPVLKNAKPALRSYVSLFAAYDAGGILPRAGDPFERGFLHSSTLGLQVRNGLLQAELSVSAPISAPQTVRSDTSIITAVMRLTI